MCVSLKRVETIVIGYGKMFISFNSIYNLEEPRQGMCRYYTKIQTFKHVCFLLKQIYLSLLLVIYKLQYLDMRVFIHT